jgi:hypothetical protein
MKNSNVRILLDVRNTMRLMLNSAESNNWDEVTALDNQRNNLLSGLSKSAYTGDIELIDEIIKLDRDILMAAQRAKTELNDKVALACRAKGIHNQYQTIADL